MVLGSVTRQNPENWMIFTLEYREDVRIGRTRTRGSRWMVYAREASPNSSKSVVYHAKKKSTAVEKARDIAKDYRPSKLRIYNKEGSNYRQHDYMRE